MLLTDTETVTIDPKIQQKVLSLVLDPAERAGICAHCGLNLLRCPCETYHDDDYGIVQERGIE